MFPSISVSRMKGIDLCLSMTEEFHECPLCIRTNCGPEVRSFGAIMNKCECSCQGLRRRWLSIGYLDAVGSWIVPSLDGALASKAGTYFDIEILACRNPWRKESAFFRIETKSELPDEIAAVRAERRCFEEPRDELMILNGEYILLSEGAAPFYALLLLHELRRHGRFRRRTTCSSTGREVFHGFGHRCVVCSPVCCHRWWR